MRFAANEVRLQLHALAYNLANFLCTLAPPEAIERWSLTSLRERLINAGVRLVRNARYAVFQMAEAALPRQVFAGILVLSPGCAIRLQEQHAHDRARSQIRDIRRSRRESFVRRMVKSRR